MSKIKLLKGLASLFKKKSPKKKEMFGPARDPEVDYETAAALKKSRKRYNLERQNLNPLRKDLDRMMEESNKKIEESTNELKIMLSEIEEMTKQIDEFNKIADDQGLDEALEQINRILNPKRTLNADGGRIGKFKGGILGLLKRINPKLERDMVKTGPFQTGHRGDVVGDMEQIKSLIRNDLTDLEEIGKLEDMILESPRYGDKMKSAFMKLIDYEKFRANTIFENDKIARFIKEDPEGAEAFLQSMYKAAGSSSGFNEGGRVGMDYGGFLNPEKLKEQFGDLSRSSQIGLMDAATQFSGSDAAFDAILKLMGIRDGGRVGMFKGGKLIGEGIEQAARLILSGKKPFGQKQTYRQKVKMKGVSDDQFDKIFQEQLKRVPDEVDDQATADGLYQSLREAEAIITGQKLGLLNQEQRTSIAKAMKDKVRDQIFGDNSRLSNDYLEYMDDAVARVEDIIQIGELGGDLTPKPIFDGSEIIGAQVDFNQLPELLQKKFSKKSADIIPFKPRTKKAGGGITSAADIDYINEATLDAIRDKPMLSRSTRMSNINDALEDLEKYLPKLFEANQGGLTPPQKGPMSEGMGTLYRRK